MSDESGANVCRYCGLPISPGLFSRTRSPENPSEIAATGSDGVADASSGERASGEDAAYCCFGCRFAAAVAAEGGEEGQNRWTLTRLGLAIFFSMNVMVLTMALWSRDVYADQESVQTTTASAMYELLRFGCLLFSCPVLLMLGQPILEQSWYSLRRGQITMDWLLVAGVVASFVYSALALWTGAPHVYFEVGCMVLVFVTLGRWLEATGKLRTTQAVRSLQRLLPSTARLCIAAGETEDRPLDQVRIGEVIRILPGERIPLDGTVERSRATIDQQLITGESQPVVREQGDRLFAGSLNLDGDLFLRVDAPSSSGTLQRLVELVTAALASKSHEQRLADRVTAWFVPLVGVISVGTFALALHNHGWHDAIMASLAVVLIACPCALGIATPMAFWAALGTACRKQVLFRNGDALSRLASIQAICFDKTGTLTSGDVEVEQLLVEPSTDRDSLFLLANQLAAASNHPLSRAIVGYVRRATEGTEADASHRQAIELEEVQSIAGRGICGTHRVSGQRVFLGNLTYLEQSGLVPSAVLPSTESNAAHLLAYIGWDGKVRGVFQFRETLRDEVRATLESLRQMGVQATILTGDHQARAKLLSDQLQVPVIAELLPHEKLEELQKLRAQYGHIAMVGDGVNDAPALAAADVGMAMGCGADVSRDAADVCLLGNDLARIPWAIEWARQTRRTVRQNLFWAFGYNAVGVSLAIYGWLSPIVAAIAMVGSSLFVISNSLRLASGIRGEGAISSEPVSADSVNELMLEEGTSMDDDHPSSVTHRHVASISPRLAAEAHS